MYSYWKETPWWMLLLLAAVLILALFPICNLVFLGLTKLDFAPTEVITLTGLGQLGDFFGGHTAAFTGSLSLVVVLFFTHHQAKQQAAFFALQTASDNQQAERTFFLEGIGLITQWDLAQPGADQCLRLLDYYGRLALTSEDKELLLILNTVITAQISKNLRGGNGSFRRTNYPFACEAIEKIGEIREVEGRARSAEKLKAKSP